MLPARTEIHMLDVNGKLHPSGEQGTQPGHDTLARPTQAAGRLRAARRRPPRQRPELRPGAAGPHGRLPVQPRPGSLPGRRGPVPGRGRLAVPHLPRLRGRDGPRRGPGGDHDAASAATGTAATTRTSTRSASSATPLTTQLLHAVGVAHAAKLRGEDTVVAGHVRRRRHQRRRLPRGAELRRRLPPARGLLRPEQPVRHLRAARAPVRGAVAGAQGRRLRHGRASAWTATTWSRCSPCWAGPWSGPRRRRPAPGRGPHLPDAGAHQRRRRHPLPPGQRSRRVGGQGPADADEDLPDGAAACSTTSGAATDRREGRSRGHPAARRA